MSEATKMSDLYMDTKCLIQIGHVNQSGVQANSIPVQVNSKKKENLKFANMECISVKQLPNVLIIMNLTAKTRLPR